MIWWLTATLRHITFLQAVVPRPALACGWPLPLPPGCLAPASFRDLLATQNRLLRVGVDSMASGAIIVAVGAGLPDLRDPIAALASTHTGVEGTWLGAATRLECLTNSAIEQYIPEHKRRIAISSTDGRFGSNPAEVIAGQKEYSGYGCGDDFKYLQEDSSGVRCLRLQHDWQGCPTRPVRRAPTVSSSSGMGSLLPCPRSRSLSRASLATASSMPCRWPRAVSCSLRCRLSPSYAAGPGARCGCGAPGLDLRAWTLGAPGATCHVRSAAAPHAPTRYEAECVAQNHTVVCTL